MFDFWTAEISSLLTETKPKPFGLSLTASLDENLTVELNSNQIQNQLQLDYLLFRTLSKILSNSYESKLLINLHV